jgi:hypothetical protein
MYKKINLEDKTKALHIGSVSGSYYGNFNATKMTVRRASDDALLTVDMMNDEHWKKRLEEFCNGTDGYLCNYL